MIEKNGTPPYKKKRKREEKNIKKKRESCGIKYQRNRVPNNPWEANNRMTFDALMKMMKEKERKC